MMRIFFLTVILLSSSFGSSLFDSMMKSQSKLLNAYNQTNKIYIDAYKRSIELNIELYKRELTKSWGKSNVILSGKKNSTFYSDNLKSRVNVDFEKGEFEVEIVSKKKPGTAIFQKKIQDLQEAKTTSIDKELIFNDLKIKPKNEESSIIRKIVKANEKVAKTEIKSKKLNNGNSIYTVKKKLKKDYLIVMASKYIDKIIEYSKKYHVNIEYILTIIQIESSFKENSFVPKVPAVGLMQIVPKTGGRDAYYYVTGKDIIPSISYLFKPENNIELGTAYISKIQNYYLDGIKDQEKLYLSTSTAYNTGIGNLRKSLSGAKNKKRQTVDYINGISLDTLYRKLTNKNLFSGETTRYIRKVKKYLVYWNKNISRLIVQ